MYSLSHFGRIRVPTDQLADAQTCNWLNLLIEC